MKSIKSQLSKIDLFKHSFGLLIEGQDRIATFSGALLSIVLVAVIFFAFISSDLMNKTNPNVIEKTITTDDIPQIKFGTRKFPFAFSLVNATRFPLYDKTMFSIDVMHYSLLGSDMRLRPIPTRQCTAADFVKNLNMPPSQFTCIDEYEFDIDGLITTMKSTLLSVYVRICSNKTDNVVCKTPAEIAATLYGKGFTIVYPEFGYDVDDFEDPFKVIDSTVFYPITFIVGTGSYFSISLKQIQLNTDDGVFTANPKTQLSYMTDSAQIQTIIITNFVDNVNFTHNVLQVNFESSRNILKVSRKYQNLQQLLANLAGLANI